MAKATNITGLGTHPFLVLHVGLEGSVVREHEDFTVTAYYKTKEEAEASIRKMPLVDREQYKVITKEEFEFMARRKKDISDLAERMADDLGESVSDNVNAGAVPMTTGTFDGVCIRDNDEDEGIEICAAVEIEAAIKILSSNSLHITGKQKRTIEEMLRR